MVDGGQFEVRQAREQSVKCGSDLKPLKREIRQTPTTLPLPYSGSGFGVKLRAQL